MSRTTTLPSTRRSTGRPQSKDENEKGMWLSLLEEAATGKNLPEKNLIVLGGSAQVQKSFLATLTADQSRRPTDRHRKKPPIANEFVLGYTYQDVLDADHEDILARLSIYLLSDPSPAFGKLLKPLITAKSIPETLLVVLLDWNEPWHWAAQLRSWISLITSITSSMDLESEEVANQTMKEWQERKRGGIKYDIGSSTTETDVDVKLPLGEGEWDLPLGLPLAVVCHNADKISTLEIEHNWREEDFDFVLQSLRTVLLKHGASLIYTSDSSPNSLPNLIHSSLGIQSSLKKNILKHNVIDRDMILVPPNWDTFGKIRVLRDGFNVERISSLWAQDISTETNQANPSEITQSKNAVVESVVHIYESTITDPSKSRLEASKPSKAEIELSIPSHQAFLAAQQETIERMKAEDTDSTSTNTTSRLNNTSNTSSTVQTSSNAPERMNDQIGPVQVNMGGIQVDAGDAVRRLKSNGASSGTSGRSASSTRGGGGGGSTGSGGGGAGGGDPGTPASAMATPEREMRAQNEKLNDFFAGLMKRGASGSPRNTPTGEGKRGTPKDKGKDDGGKKLFGKE